MLKKTPLLWLIAGLVAALAIILSGCSTKKPWTPNPGGTFTVFIISGPTDSLQVPLGSAVAYNWSYNNTNTRVQYQHSFDGGEWSALSRETVASISSLTLGYHTFAIRAVDESGATSEVSAVFEVIWPTLPTVVITESPDSGTFVASGSSVVFTWAGDDGRVGPNYLTYRYIFVDSDTSAWSPATTVTFNQVTPVDPAVFKVWAKDLGGNISEPASISFIIKNASILYVDDYQWKDSFGDVDRAKERDQKSFYRETLRGFSFAEWDNDVAGAVPTMANLAGYTTIIWAADADNGCNADPNGRLWSDVGEVGGGVLKQFIDGGGHLIISGCQIMYYLNNSNPPSPADFEAAYLGVSDTLVDVIDSTVTPWDTTHAPTWVSNNLDFTWAIKDANQTGSYPDSMKFDIGKSADLSQLECNESLVYLKAGVEPIFTTGLDVAGDPPTNYGEVCGWLYAPNGHAISATFTIDTYSMPMLGIRQTFHSILGQFGETPSF